MSLTRPQPRQTYTAEDLERFPSDARYELIRGDLHPMPPPAGGEHGKMTYNLVLDVGWFVRSNDLGEGYAAETGFIVERNPDTVMAPDFAFVAKDRLATSQDGFVPLVPDLVLETRSPSDRPREVAAKVQRWLAVGVRVVWELDPQARVLTVHRPNAAPRALGANDTLTGDEVLPGFALALRRLFREVAS